MIIWIIFFIFIAYVIHHLGHRISYSRSGLAKHTKNRFRWIQSVIDIVSVTRGKRLPVVSTQDFWAMPADTPMRTRFRAGMGGAVMSFLAAVVIFTVLAFSGLPKPFAGQYVFDEAVTELESELTVVHVTNGSSAYSNGIRPSDVPVRIGGETIRDSGHFNELSLHFNEKNVEFVTLGEDRGVSVAIDEAGDSGISVKTLHANSYTSAAPFVGFVTALQVPVLWAGEIINGGDDQAFTTMRSASYLGYAYLLYVLGSILAIHAVISLIPLRPFDLGRVFFRTNLTERLKQKVLPRQHS